MFSKSNLPNLIANWHSMSSTDNNSFQLINNRFNRKFVIDNESSGCLDSEKCLKKSYDLVYKSVTNTLPMFVSHNTNQIFSKTKLTKNCLIYCDCEQLLLSSFGNGITAYDLSLDNSLHEHYYSRTCPPYITDRLAFAHRLTNINDVYINHDSSPIFQLKKNNYTRDCTELTALSKRNVKMFKLYSNPSDSCERTFEASNVIDTIDDNPQHNDFKFCDRNPYFCDKILISGNGHVFDYFDINSCKSIWPKLNRNKFKYDISKQIGMEWCPNHSQSFFYGDSTKIMLVDVRGVQLPLIVFDKQESNPHFYEWEQFCAFCPSLTNDYQLYLASDYSIICVDYRYPQRNLIQHNHMLSSADFPLFSNLTNITVEEEATKKEILLLSSLYNSCMMTFERKLTVQPTSLHFPAQISSPSDDKLRFSTNHLRGVQMIPFSKENKCCFCVAMLTSDGHIFMQDFYPTDKIKEQSSSDHLESPNYGENTCDYMKCIDDYIMNQNLN